MKAKNYIMAAFVSVAAFTNMTLAGNPSDPTGNVGNVNSIDNSQSILSSHGGSDGPFTGNLLNVGIGFVNTGVTSYSTGGSGGSSSSGPAFELSYEHAIGHFGVGAFLGYQPAAQKISYTATGTSYNSSFTPFNYTNTTVDKFSLLQFAARGAYHFSAGDKFDPYIGLELGYCTASLSETFSTNDINSPGDGNTGSTSSISLTGVEFGAFFGARYFFTDHIGAWVELQYADAAFSYMGYSGSGNPCTLLNLGLAFKF